MIEVELHPRDSLQIAEALKIIMPETPLFLVTEQDILQQVKKEALSTGIDAVFAKDDDVTSLVECPGGPRV